MITLNFRRLAYFLTPPSERINVDGDLSFTINWLQYLLNPLNTLISAFDLQRKSDVVATNVTSQTAVLEWYLNYLHDPDHQRIRIYHYSDGGVHVQNSFESTPDYLAASNIGETPDTSSYIPLSTEGDMLTDVSFYVDVPSSINENIVRADIEKYRFTGKDFEIQTI